MSLLDTRRHEPLRKKLFASWLLYGDNVSAKASPLYGICGSIGMILAGLGGFAAFLALLDGSYAQAAASALVALLLCPFAAPMLLSLAGSALIVAASALLLGFF